MKLKAPKYTLKQQLAAAKREVREMINLFAIQHTRDQKAVALWREKNARPDTLPDMGTLLEWLIDRGDRWQAVLEAAREIAIKQTGESPLRAALKRHDEFWGAKP